MAEPLNRDEVVGLLEDLGSARDETVLAAARALHAKVAAADMSWQDLLRPQDDGTAGDSGPEADSEPGPRDDPDQEDEADPGIDPGAESAAAAAGEAEAPSDNDAESLALIEGLLAKKGISAELRQELRDYKSDIAEGAFDQSDRKYLRAMHQRLTKGA